MIQIAIIIQARMTSTRLPGKILMEANGISFLQHQFNRLKTINLPVIIATTVNDTDDRITTFCLENNLGFYRGSENDVLSRYYECAKAFDVKNIIRITSDCPLIDAELILNAANEYKELNNENIYLSNSVIRTYPRGFDFEIFSFFALENAFLNATLDADKEHVTPYIRNNRSGKIMVEQVTDTEDHSSFRLTLDTGEDHQLLKQLIENYGAADLTGQEIIELLHQHPELVKINAHIEQKKV